MSLSVVLLLVSESKAFFIYGHASIRVVNRQVYLSPIDSVHIRIV
jgi:hypothetical protein